MKTLFSIFIVVLVIALIFCVTQSVCAATLGEFRWHAFTLANISVSGTARVTTAQVDSFVVNAEGTVATDFTLTSYFTNEKLDTFVTTQTDPAHRTQQYALNSDFIPGGLLWAERKEAKPDAQWYSIGVGLPPPPASKPTETSELSMVWTGADQLFLQPVTQSTDSIIICYRALPARMIHADSSTEVDAPLHRMIIVLAAADIAKRTGQWEREAALRAEYAAFKAERLILPKAELEGGQQ